MKNLTATLCLSVALLFGCTGVCKSADFLKGFIAYQSGDYATALREWTPLAKQGHADAQFLIGTMYSDGGIGVPQDYKTAVKWYRLAAKQGYASAQNNLGNRYLKGQGVPQDYKTAVKWFRLAAKQGLADAQGNLGAMYAFGKGLLKDYVYAHMWGNIAAMNGSKLGAKLRVFVEKKITPAQIATAQKLARECVAKNYKGC